MAILEYVSRDVSSVPHNPSALLTDGDNTLFLPGTADPYPDARRLLSQLQTPNLTLVSANPDSGIAAARLDALKELAPAQWISMKYTLGAPVGINILCMQRPLKRLLTQAQLRLLVTAGLLM